MDRPPEEVALNEIVDALVTEPRFATGELSPLRAVSGDEALSVLDAIYAGAGDADRRLPVLAERTGQTIACHRGCPGKCCESLVLVSIPEALNIATELARPERRDVRQRFMSRVASWLQDCRARGEEAARVLAAGDHGTYLSLLREHAQPDQPRASLITSRAHEDFYDKANQVLAGLQNAMGGGTSLAPLPVAVLGLLADDAEAA
ncbi:MAG TPA: hypothetical protein VK698_17810 [Kofleriaceae bacterium]|nr:hypothetical protein [Kofleriaceae bacterium]